MILPEEVIIAVNNRLKSAESSLRSAITARDDHADKVRRANESIQKTTAQIAELTAFLAQHTGED